MVPRAPGGAAQLTAEGPAIAGRTGEVGGLRAAWREGPAGRPAPVLYVHGVPDASWLWVPFLERTGGIAPDLPGFGSSAKPEGFDYSIGGYADWLAAFVDAAGLDRFSLVVHDWGVVGLALAQRIPERIDRLVVQACVPLFAGYRWHWVARSWRTPVLGELFMATSNRWSLKQISRQSNASRGPMPAEFLDRVWADFDRGTRRAILALYRSGPPSALGEAGRDLGRIACPTLVLWPTEDPYIGPEWGARYAEALGGSPKLEMIGRAGHWPWLDRPEVIDRTAEFLSDG